MIRFSCQNLIYQVLKNSSKLQGFCRKAEDTGKNTLEKSYLCAHPQNKILYAVVLWGCSLRLPKKCRYSAIVRFKHVFRILHLTGRGKNEKKRKEKKIQSILRKALGERLRKTGIFSQKK